MSTSTRIVISGTTFYPSGTRQTSYPTNRVTSNFDSFSNRQQNIISTGTKVAIGVGVTIGVLALLACIGTCCLVSRQRDRRRKRNLEAEKMYRMSASTHGTHHEHDNDTPDMHDTQASSNPYNNYNHTSGHTNNNDMMHTSTIGQPPPPTYHQDTYKPHVGGTGGDGVGNGGLFGHSGGHDHTAGHSSHHDHSSHSHGGGHHGGGHH